MKIFSFFCLKIGLWLLVVSVHSALGSPWHLDQDNFLQKQEPLSKELIPVFDKNLPLYRLVYMDKVMVRPLKALLEDPQRKISYAIFDELLYFSVQGEPFKFLTSCQEIFSVKNCVITTASIDISGNILLGTSTLGFIFFTIETFSNKVPNGFWADLSYIYPDLNMGAGYWQPIYHSVASKQKKGVFYLLFGQAQDLLRLDTFKREFDLVSVSSGGFLSSLQVRYDAKSSKEKIILNSDQQIFELSRTVDSANDINHGTTNDKWQQKVYPNTQAATPERSLYYQEAQDRRGLYLTAYSAARPQKLQETIEILKEKGFNSLVVDLKNDMGCVMYASKIPLVQELGALCPVIDLENLVSLLNSQGITLIARFVLFKDRYLYRYQNHRYATWNSQTRGPWAHYIQRFDAQGNAVREQTEYWVDPFSLEVHAYNLDIAEEILHLGVDEIQFDYIRAPSDGDLNTLYYRHRKADYQSMADALEDFLYQARVRLKAPIGVDLFGYTGSFLSNYLGQNLQRMALYVDSISPMFYPSHYPKKFLGPNRANYQRAFDIYYLGSNQSYLLTGAKVHIRPYVQAFLLGAERTYTPERYKYYLQMQLKAVEHSQSTGFFLWNNSNNYYMLDS